MDGTLFGKKIFADGLLKVRSLLWTLIQHDWRPIKGNIWTQAQKEDDVTTRGERHLQATERPRLQEPGEGPGTDSLSAATNPNDTLISDLSPPYWAAVNFGRKCSAWYLVQWSWEASTPRGLCTGQGKCSDALTAIKSLL